MTTITVQIRGVQEEVQLSPGHYENGRKSLTLIDPMNFIPHSKATVNVDENEYPVKAEELLIKDYSENVGMLKSLVDADIIEDTGRTVPTGFVTVHVCTLTEEGWKLFPDETSSEPEKQRHEYLGEEERKIVSKMYKDGDGITIHFDFQNPDIRYVLDSPSMSPDEKADFIASFTVLLLMGMLKPVEMTQLSNSQIFILSDIGNEVTAAFTN